MPITRRTLLGGVAALSLPLPARAETAPVALTILHTNDIHGHMWHPGEPQGLVRLATFIQQIRAEMPNVVLMDAGDIIHGTPESKAFHGKASLDTMNALHYDVATAGNHEFDFGQKVLHEALDYVRFPVLSANVIDTKTGKPWGKLKPVTVITRGGVRIGVFGLTTPTTVQIEWPRTLDGIAFTDPVAAAQKAVTELREKQKVDVVVALSHLGYEEDRKLAPQLSGVDVIIGGHSHTSLDEPVWVNNILIAQTGAHGKALGRVDLLVRPAQGGQPGSVVSINGKDGKWWGTGDISAPLGKRYPTTPLIKPQADTAEDATALAAYRPWSDRLRPTLQETLTTATEPIPAQGVTSHETPFGNLLADSIRAATKTDIAFMSSSQINPVGLKAGTITVEDLYEALGSYTRQHLVIARVPGQEIVRVLTTARSGANAGKYPVHLSGVRVNEHGDVIVGDAPIVVDRIYSVASGAHVIQDYFYQKPGVEIISDAVDAPTVRDAAIVYLRGHTPLQVDERAPLRWQPARPTTSGR